MTEKKVYLGSEGPFLFDTADDLDDPDGDWSGEKVAAIRAEQIQITGVPGSSGEVLRYEELISDLRRYSVLASPTITSFTPTDKRDSFRYSFMLGG